ncbi:MULTISPECIES: DUF2244 domain-containing protein [Candidatus Accumulibacter]|jgi:uncharacterized membrane protein|uniref:DUF2244 domain-containing protein n=2 Tax=Candidatus Accumulibacter TaxID=327159 RepID=A0A080LTL1_9PROT|nr:MULTISPECIES: DUF2244 domain-containing protein [Candidatus Accumulibacter]KFB71857.1 MAG: hypothetical protein AW09_002998 [Candidatus Accumulibacter phosphatis]HRF11362.1 DUF2244 domain-containing protein [Candidatus Accumulibacter phosphatis]
MSLVAARTLTGRTWVARPNQSLSVTERNWVFVAMAAASSTIAIVFLYFGAWPVLPFTGIELALLWWALRHSEETAEDFERIALESGQLTIETRRGALAERHAFQPYWVRLQYVKPQGQSSHRLLIRSHGREVEVGRMLTEEQKKALASELKQSLGAAWPDKISKETN